MLIVLNNALLAILKVRQPGHGIASIPDVTACVIPQWKTVESKAINRYLQKDARHFWLLHLNRRYSDNRVSDGKKKRVARLKAIKFRDAAIANKIMGCNTKYGIGSMMKELKMQQGYHCDILLQ